jgi:hypothetical protein
MKTNPKDGGRYQKSVKRAKQVAKAISLQAEKEFGLPRGSVRICLTKMSARQRESFIGTARL